MDETLHQRWRREFFRAGGGGDGGGDRGEDIEMGENPDPKFFPFASEMDWRVACWAIEDGVKEKLGLSYHNIHALHKIVDHNIPARAEWKLTMIFFTDTPDNTHLIQYRDVLSAIRTLLGNPVHAENIVYHIKNVFTDASRDSRIYHEMWTRKWWHAIQAHLLSRVALVPVIIATDKTQLTQFFNSKSAYPVISCWETYPEP
ncbi:hypothetical protein SERLA73DRAFT_150310 [Serpula lacrymans var. lacrymans S7.3]|uniref:Uncharacterized protein n=1 Tax=Serpula lacrymans var. lacrymans (strain S7.3) TaxID=936435 RepID=F8PM09_SERL3|nr:hypothetical protein SERLA73DRAFT_150310 [Serpula lacrymans var. lacrymans S7.3]